MLSALYTLHLIVVLGNGAWIEVETVTDMQFADCDKAQRAVWQGEVSWTTSYGDSFEIDAACVVQAD